MELYNTLSKKKEEFKPLKKNEVRMYVCGPTVNDVPHLGHARVNIVFDCLRRYLKFSGYKVKFVSNITDIEDKIIKKANELGISIEELTNKNTKTHMEDYAKLGVLKPDYQPKATEYVEEMIELVQKLEEKGYTYVVPNDGVYYDISKFKDYGKLSGIDLTQLKSSRELKDETKGQKKKDNKDFVLWKFSKDNEPSWDSPWGKGRPGWHIECSAMSKSILGLPLDIHGGGQDLIFPHHEDEIAQSEAGYGEKFCNFWVHNGMINIDKVKMSKSLGNFRTIRDLLEKYSGMVIRYFVLNTHYRKPVDFSFDKLNESKASYERLKGLVLDLKNDQEINDEYLDKFKEEMDEDMNTSGALNVLWSLVKDKEAKGKVKTIKEMERVLGLELFKKEKFNIPEEVLKLAKMREDARQNKDFAKSDELRDKIQELGYQVNDTKEGFNLILSK